MVAELLESITGPHLAPQSVDAAFSSHGLTLPVAICSTVCVLARRGGIRGHVGDLIWPVPVLKAGPGGHAVFIRWAGGRSNSSLDMRSSALVAAVKPMAASHSPMP